MHYVPDSARELLQGQADAEAGLLPDEQSFHYRSAPIYLLTAVVGVLLAADLVLALVGGEVARNWRFIGGQQLAAIAAVLGGVRILYQTLDSILDGRVGADLALSIATLAAIILGENVTAALVVFIALCGESIEGYTIDRARKAIRNIFRLRPAKARLLRDGKEFEIRIEEVTLGDQLLIRPGERIPVDGRVTAGESTIDQSALTGESFPVDVTTDDAVFAGTLNQFGSVTIAAEKVGEETSLAQVIRLVAEAAEQKSSIERTADRLARLFLPAVLAIAGITLLVWRIRTGFWQTGFNPALGVLVVACPCALVLATPTAVMAAMAWLARAGIVVKGSNALERFASIDTVAFDKTGTLTRGQLVISSIVCPENENEVLRIAAIAERSSEHLLARAIVGEAESRNMVVPRADEFQAYPGGGVIAQARVSLLGNWAASQIDGRSIDDDPGRRCQIVVGNLNLLEAEEIAFPENFPISRADFDEFKATPIFVALDRKLLGILGVSDQPRVESSSVILELKADGVEQVALLTGDHPAAASWLAGEIAGIDEVHSQLLPVDKAEWIKGRQAAGHKVAMVGDGVNDAPALALSTVGIAIGNVGNDIAAEAGDLVLMGNSLATLPSLRRLSRQLVANIQQSIYLFAFGMNAIGMLLCAVGLLSPVGGAIFHEASSLAVMLNAMRLLWFERYEETRLGRLSQGVTGFSEWLTEAFSPSRIVFSLIRYRFLLLRLAGVICVLVWLLSGIVKIESDEQAFVTRFGRFEKELTPGLHWRYPAPFERVERMKAGRIRRLTIGFQAAADSELATSPNTRKPGIVEWTSRHSATDFVFDEPVRLSLAEMLVLTGDEVPVELMAEVHYSVSDFYRYRYGSDQPTEIVHAVADHLLRTIAAGESLNEMLIDNRAAIEKQSLADLRRQLQPFDLGIEIVDFVLLDIHPPQEVVPAYRDISDAWENRQQLINESEGYYVRTVMSAAGERAIDYLHDSTAGQTKADSSRSGWSRQPWELNDEIWSQLTSRQSNAPAGTTANGEADGRNTGMLLSGAAAAALAQAERDQTQQVENARGRASRFTAILEADQQSMDLTQTHLYWKAVAESLAGKDLTIIDPRSSRRQQLILWGQDASAQNVEKDLPESLPRLLAPPESEQPDDDETDSEEPDTSETTRQKP